VNLFEDDFQTILSFYRDALGFEATEVDPGAPSNPKVNWVSLRTGVVTIELFDGKTFWDSKLLRGANRDALQLCFIVDDVERERERLQGSGVDCDPIIDEAWGSYASFRDPEGNWLQIYEVLDQAS
jgi:catechol 2,3-dioxygenase-like lactoylglutathione lyase family enzyme